jgi:hypothetical protein
VLACCSLDMDQGPKYHTNMKCACRCILTDTSPCTAVCLLNDACVAGNAGNAGNEWYAPTPPCETHLPLDCYCNSGVNSNQTVLKGPPVVRTHPAL